MSAPVPLSPSEEVMWRAFAQVLHSLPRTLERELQVNASISTREYVSLANLADHRPDGLRIDELAKLVGLSPSRVSRLVDKLHAEGLVDRAKSADDARSRRVTITDRGLGRVQAVWPRHIDSVRRHVLSKIDPADYPALTRTFRALLDLSPDTCPDGDT